MVRHVISRWSFYMASVLIADVFAKKTQYRDSDKREIDFVIERDDGATLGIEIKAGGASSNS